MAYAYLRYLLRFMLAAGSGLLGGRQPAGSPRPDQPGRAAKNQPQLTVPFGSPVLLANADYVLYPLSLGETMREEAGEYGSSDSRSEYFWNIAFYNPKTGAAHLLAQRKMLIRSYTTDTDNSPGAAAAKTVSVAPLGFRLLYYAAVTTDFNRDGQLTEEDPTYLFSSDEAGENFTQLSPDSLHVLDWEVQPNTGKLLMRAQQDSNHNRKFGESDAIIPYVYDLASRQPATTIFGPAFTKKLRAEFARHWAPQP